MIIITDHHSPLFQATNSWGALTQSSWLKLVAWLKAVSTRCGVDLNVHAAALADHGMGKNAMRNAGSEDWAGLAIRIPLGHRSILR